MDEILKKYQTGIMRMESTIKISIIIPVYNTRKEYLEKCLKSILSQSMKEIEILIIDDGSIRVIAEICDKYSEYGNVYVYHISNRGVSGARNYGIKKSSGEYIMFVDSDDWLERGTCEECYNRAKAGGDIFIFSYWDEYIGRSVIYAGRTEKEEMFSTEMNYMYSKGLIYEGYMPYLGIIGASWCRLFKREFLETYNILFPEGISTIEDKIFNLRIMENNPKIRFFDQCFYHYRKCGNSLCHQVFDIEKFEKYIELMRSTMERVFPEEGHEKECFDQFARALFLNNWKNILRSSNIKNLKDMEQDVERSFQMLKDKGVDWPKDKIKLVQGGYYILLRLKWLIPLKVLLFFTAWKKKNLQVYE